MAAKLTALEQLHELVAQGYTEELRRQMANGEITPALLTSASKFLKDNGVDVDPEENDQMKGLKAVAGDVLKFPFDPATE